MPKKSNYSGVSVEPGMPFWGDLPPVLLPKLQVPRLHSSLVVRSRLLSRLDAGFERRLSLVSAPAGYGKTTLVCQWIARRGARDLRQRVAWVSLDAGDNDPIRFWLYLIMACQGLDRHVGDASLATLLNATNSGAWSWHAHLLMPSIETLLETFLNEVNQIPNKSVLVLEDYHLITTQSIHDTIAKFVEHLPPNLHLVFITRGDPPFPLARLRVRDDLVELRASDLSFSQDEIRDFFQKSIPYPLPDEAVKRLEIRTEGWVAGMRLLALALQKRADPSNLEDYLQTFSGSHRHLLEYFITEVLDAQPETVQEFLLRTSLLNRLTGPLCDAITGRKDSGLLLKELERTGLFLLPLDDSGEWYRYHALFAEAVRHEARSRLGRKFLSNCYRQASAWYEQSGMLPEAVEASLSAGEYMHAARLIEKLAKTPQRNERHGLHTLQRWLEQLPEESLQAWPGLCFLYANALVFLSVSNQLSPESIRVVEKVLQMAENGWRSEGNLPGLGEIFAFRALLVFRQGEITNAASLARQSLSWLPVDEDYASSRVICLSLIGQEEQQKGNFEAAREKYLESLALTEASSNLPGKRVMLHALGVLFLSKGEMHRANEYFRQELSLAEEDITDREQALLGLAQVLYEWNDLDGSESGIREVLQISTQFSDEIPRVRASLLLARILRARGKAHEAQDLLQELHARLQASRLPFLYREVIDSRFSLQLSLGDIAAAGRWVSNPEPYEGFQNFLLQRDEALLTARAWMLLGEADKAVQLLDEWMENTQRLDHTRAMVEIHLLKSMNLSASGQAHKAKELIREALPRAYHEGYQRLFIDYGEPAKSILRSASADVNDKNLFVYLRSVLQAFATEPESPAPAGTETALTGVFSAQEQRILRLLEAGLTRQEIAGELVISNNTLKTHLRHIYQKLNVNSRSEAIEAARQLLTH